MNLLSSWQRWAGRIKASILLLSLLTAFVLPMSVKASAAGANVVRVGYDISGSMLYQDEAGDYRGYNMEFLYEIAKYTGWKYELIPFTKWADAVQAVEAGRIDILPTVLKSPERDGRVLFSDRRMGVIHVALVVPEDNQQHFYGAWDSLQGARIGVRENTVDSADFFDWAGKQKLQYQAISYDDRQNLIAALDSGTIDAAALSYIGAAKQYRAIAEFAPQDMYFAVAPTRPDVLNELNQSMGQITIINPQFYPNLLNKYMENSAVPKAVFSKGEREFIDSGQSVRVALMRNAEPFSAVQDGRFVGIIPDMLRRIGEISGLEFEFLAVDTQEEAIQSVRDGRADMVGRLADNVFFARKNGLRLTTPYVYMPMMQLRHKSTENVKVVGVQGMAQMDQIRSSRKYPDTMQMEVYADIEQCFEALVAGKVDAVYCDQVTANYFMDTHRYSEYRMDLLQPFSYDLTFGINQDAPAVLSAILDKSIRCITVAETDEIIMENRIREPMTLESLLGRLPGHYLAGFILLLTGITVFLAYASLKLWHKRGIEQRMRRVHDHNQQIEADLAVVRRVNEMKEQFFARIDEDICCPMEHMTKLSEEVAEAVAAGQAADPELLKALAADSRKMQSVLGEMLLLDHLERGAVKLQWKPVDSLQFLRQLAAGIRAQAEVKKLVFHMDLSGLEQRTILLDEKYTQEIFQRVLDNAIKFTPPGGTISFSVESFLSPRGRFVIWSVIKDTGIGMRREFLPKACEVFTQEKRPGIIPSGNGLGLAIVHKLVELMAGDIELRSRENEGTEIRLELYFDLEKEMSGKEEA